MLLTVRSTALLLGAAALVARALPAHAAADLDFRESLLRHVCDKGSNDGNVCCPAAPDCPDGKCVVDATGKVSAVLTIVVDNDVSNLDGSKIAGTQVRAVTTIVEIKGKTGPTLAQTFQGLDANNLLASLAQGPTDQFNFNISEGLLARSVDATGTGIPLDASFLIFRTLDPETVKELRTEAGLQPDGPELLVVQPGKIRIQRFAAHWAPAVQGDVDAVDNDPFATVLRVKVNAFFVAPRPPECVL